MSNSNSNINGNQSDDNHFENKNELKKTVSIVQQRKRKRKNFIPSIFEVELGMYSFSGSLHVHHMLISFFVFLVPWKYMFA